VSATTPADVPRRSAAGRARRAAIIAATLELLGTEGRAAVTHRRVAARAGVPLASTTYYFSSLDDLITEAMRSAARFEAERGREVATLLSTMTVDETAALLARSIAKRCGEELRVTTVAVVELRLDAARRDLLRAEVGDWLQGLTDMLGEIPGGGDTTAAGEARRRAVIAGLDGLVLHSLLADRPPAAEELLPVVLQILRA
jgi:DNA-binding transcriptional regulator YbjK